MLQLLFHLWGDYITQNHWMANKKVLFTKEGWLACLIHCVLYSIPFSFIASPTALAVIFGTHFLIDKFRLAKYVNQFKNWSFTPTGFPEGTPPFLSIWLLFIVDNILHVTINFAALGWLN
jgi:hypothetical protein